MATQRRPYRLYYSPDSASIVPRILLAELGAPCEAILVDRARNEQQSPEYRRLNPQGLLPVLIDGNSVVFETGAIVQYLCDLHGRLAPGVDSGARGDFCKWLFYLSNTLHADLRILFYTHRYTVDVDSVPALRRGMRQRIGEHFGLLDRVLQASETGWLLDWGLSACDFYLAVCARWAVLYPPGEALTSPVPMDFPGVARVLERLQERPAVLAAYRTERIPPPVFTHPQRPEGMERLLRGGVDS